MKRILIVEDDGILALSMDRMVGKLGFVSVGTVARGDQVLEHVQKSKPDLILMDIILQGPVDGIEAADEVNSIYNIPIIYVTGNSDMLTIDRARKTRHAGFIKKPVSVTELKGALHSALNPQP